MAITTTEVKGRPNTWQVDVAFTLPSGQPYRKRKRLSGMTRTQAKNWGTQHMQQVLAGGPASVKKPEPAAAPVEVPTMEAFLDTYIGHCEAARQKPSTLNQKRSVFKAHLAPALGKVRVDQVGQQHIAAIRLKMKDLNPQTVNNALAQVSTMLKTAGELGFAMPSRLKFGLLRVVYKEAAFYDFGDFQRLLDGARKMGTDSAVMVLLGCHAGLRMGELCALRWVDVDLPNRRLHVRQAVWSGRLGLPKGNRPRTVDMTATLAEALSEHRHLRGPYILGGAETFPRRAVVAMMKAVQRRAGMLENGRMHIMRHTFCSHLAMKGASVTTIQRLAGHANLATTMKYMHLSPDAVRSAVNLLDGPGITGNGLATATAPNTKPNEISALDR